MKINELIEQATPPQVSNYEALAGCVGNGDLQEVFNTLVSVAAGCGWTYDNNSCAHRFASRPGQIPSLLAVAASIVVLAEGWYDGSLCMSPRFREAVDTVVSAAEATGVELVTEPPEEDA